MDKIWGMDFWLTKDPKNHKVIFVRWWIEPILITESQAMSIRTTKGSWLTITDSDDPSKILYDGKKTDVSRIENAWSQRQKEIASMEWICDYWHSHQWNATCNCEKEKGYKVDWYTFKKTISNKYNVLYPQDCPEDIRNKAKI